MICPHCGGAISYRIVDEKRKQILDLNKQGFSARDIQTLTNISFSSVARIVRETKKSRSRTRKKKPTDEEKQPTKEAE